MKLYLIQHGEALVTEVDPERPLSEQGIIDIQRLARMLKRSGIGIKQVIHSGKLRAKQTAEIITGEINPDLQLETSDQISPNEKPDKIGLQINTWEADTLIVGHLPFMARLVSYLITGDDSQILVSFHPASIVCLELVDNMEWKINWMIRPELLV